MSVFRCSKPTLAGFVCLVVLSVWLNGCGGGGSGGRGASQGELASVTFPDPNDVNPGPLTTPPTSAPLVQQINFNFTAAPPSNEVNAETLQIRDPSGFPVPGRYDVHGKRVVFTPVLPREPSTKNGPVTTNGGAGLMAGLTYTIRTGPKIWPSFIDGVAAALRAAFPNPNDPNGFQMSMTTTTKQTDFWRGLPARLPQLVSIEPMDGSVDVMPNLFTDPEQLFPPRKPFFLTFDGPLNPNSNNLDKFLLVDLDDRPAGFPAGLPLTITARLVRNELDVSVVEVEPHGVLPFGHLLSLEYPELLRGLAQIGNATDDSIVAATFVTADTSVQVVRDVLAENFDSSRREAGPDELSAGEVPADWDVKNSNVLKASLKFRGTGKLGRFIPPPPAGSDPVTIALDTNSQNFPLLNGSTPDAPPNTVVRGGVFSFTEINIPEGIIITARGNNPLVLTATESITVAGEISLGGGDGNDENAFDSAVTTIPGAPGGAAGGRGGEGHPLFYLNNTVSLLNLVSPPTGGTGWSAMNAQQTGGRGGQSGILDHADASGCYGTDYELDQVGLQSCNELNDDHSNGYHPAGGGGGTLRKLGEQGVDGIGNVTTNGKGKYIVRPEGTPGWNVLRGGAPGNGVFIDTKGNNDFVGSRGELTSLIGGQGGGGGGSGLDSYYCGWWCMLDANPANDAVCIPETVLGNPPNLGDSVGDSRGGGGGGGGGAVALECLGEIEIEGPGRIDVSGGQGGGGEQLGCSNWAGSAGGGSAGSAILRSASMIFLRSGAEIIADRGKRRAASAKVGWLTSCEQMDTENPGAGGRGGPGLIQLQVPVGELPVIEAGADVTNNGYIDENNEDNPVEFTPFSVGLSAWFDVGRMIDRGGPSFGFNGLLPDGLVETDADGFLVDPENSDIRVDYLGLVDPDAPGQFLPGHEPRADFIPENATVRVEFQAADAASPGSKEAVNESEWMPTPSVADGRQFLRYRVTFNIAKSAEFPLTPTSARPAVQSVSIRAQY